MLKAEDLRKALWELDSQGLSTRIDSFTLRSIALRHFLPPKKPQPLRVSPSGPLGTRFAPPNSPIGVLYLAFEAETAHREGNQLFYQMRSDAVAQPADVQPPEEVVIIGVKVQLAKLLDVRHEPVMTRLGTSTSELMSSWKTVEDAPTQRLGAACWATRTFEGIIYRSAQNPDGICLAVFPERLAPDSFVRFLARTDQLSSVIIESR